VSQANSQSSVWEAHLAPGTTIPDLDLLADESLPGRWARRWRERAPWPQIQDVEGTWI
jgi:hypothetical protein